jgi:hypothetical protein
MDVAQLLEPVLTNGIKDTHFFNGRLLTADDLRTMQRAARQHDAQLGRAIGDGIAYGLQVSMIAGAGSTSTAAVLHVAKGLALNRIGEPIALAAATDLALVRTLDAPVPDGAFKICVPQTDTEFLNLGLYLLTIAPASGFEGRAPMTELSTEGLGSSCASRYEVEGVKFDMRRLTLPSDAAATPTEARTLFNTLQAQLPSMAASAVSPQLHRLQNIVAHLFFGSDDVYRRVREPLSIQDDPPESDWVRKLREAKQLSDCEVPLALIYWSIRGVEFVDMWAVRRRLIPSGRLPQALSPIAGVRVLADAEARLHQFQAQIEALRAAHPLPQTLKATDWFRFLPSAGVLPLTSPAAKGFDAVAWFTGIKTRPAPAVIEGARVEAILRESMWFPAIVDVQELVWRYQVHQNKQPGDELGAAGPRQYLVFARGNMPYFGNAHFDVAYWDYASYALSCGGVNTIFVV